MNEALEDFINDAKQRMRWVEEKLAADEHEREKLDLSNQEKIVERSRDLLPASVRECVSWYGWQNYMGNSLIYENASILVSIPRCAPILMMVALDMTSDFVMTDVRLEEFSYRDNIYPFNVCDYEAQAIEDMAGIWKPMLKMVAPGHNSFDGALRDALELGDRYQQVLEEALAKNDKLREPVRIKELFCPLSVMVEDEQGLCVRDQCAWWIGTKSKCAIAVIAFGENYGY